MANTEDARKAKKKLLKMLKQYDCAVGIGKRGDVFVLAVRVKKLTPEIRSAIPDKFEGFDVEVVEIGEIHPR